MAQTQSPAASQSAPAANKWLVALAVMLATIIEVLDMTISNVALDHIRGSLSAGVDEAAWVLTSYIIGNAIVIPLTGWLSSVFGRKRFFLCCVTLFTISSLFCGSALNLQTLVFFRVLQGLSGWAPLWAAGSQIIIAGAGFFISTCPLGPSPFSCWR